MALRETLTPCGQIEADLSYFEQGTGLISQAVASIRALVEIDQAQCDRQGQLTPRINND